MMPYCPYKAFGVLLCALVILSGCPENNIVVDTDLSSQDMDMSDQEEMMVLKSMTPRYEPDGEGFYRIPWPSDSRLVDGKISLADFPNARQVVVRVFRRALEKIEGFGTMPVVYTNFDAYPGDAAMPKPNETMEVTSPVQLFDVSAEGCGNRTPLIVDMDTEGDTYIDPNTLRATPLAGFILRPKTPYAFVVLKSFGEQAGYKTERPANFDAAWSGDGSTADSLKPLKACLEKAQINPDDIAIATVFTTQDPTRETRLLRDVVLDKQKVKAPEVADWELHVGQEDAFGVMDIYKGTVEVPIFQKGTSPYNTGGNLEFDEQGMPIVQRYEKAPFTLVIPTNRRDPMPVLLWSGGTGATQFSHLDDKFIENIARKGFAVLNFVPQFHDTRDPSNADDPITPTFNYLNPESGRTTFRQQVAESIYMLRVIREALPKVADVPPLDGDRVVYGGHSQGGIVGALIAGVTDDFAAYALNGTGGYTSSTIVYRKDYIDIEKTLRDAVSVKRPLDRLHPVVQMGQLGVEVIDPHNYAPYWKGRKGLFKGNHMFLSNGGMDTTTAKLGIDAITIAGDLPPMNEAYWNVDPYNIWDSTRVDVPISGTRMDVDGNPLTFATFLVDGRGHFVLYRVPRVSLLYVQFWESAYEGVPVLK